MQTGEVLDDKYEIQERLGAGGMGEVYKASHRWLGTTRVIKVIRPHVSGRTDAQERFVREARAATKVHHPNVATLHDFSRLPDGSHYMVWEYIDGENLAQRLRARGTLPPRQALNIAIQTLHGLEAIHRAGIVHRDVSPENLMITHEDGSVKIIDLGVAKLDDPSSSAQTQAGIFVGKLRYASPEQVGFLPEGEKLDARTDLYAVAMVVVEMLTGRPPYEAKSPHEYFVLHASEPRSRTVELPPELPASAALQVLLEKALARDRNRRWSTAGEFAAALEEVARTLPAADAKTEAIAVDGVTTVRIRPEAADTLHRETERTAAPAAPTVRTPVPAALERPLAAPPRKSRAALLWTAAALVVVLAAGSAVLLRRRGTPPVPAARTYLEESVEGAATPAETRPATAPPTAAITLTVTAGEATAAGTAGTTRAEGTPQQTASAAEPRAVPAPTPVTTPVNAPPVVPRSTPETAPPRAVAETAPAPKPAAAADVETYVDGGGDGEVNDRALEHLREEVQGVQRVALHAVTMQEELAKMLREELSLEVADSAAVVIRFDGTFERLGRGRKKRAATATIAKDGRLVFRYHLPEIVYRVGLTPAEAFTRVISDAFGQ